MTIHEAVSALRTHVAPAGDLPEELFLFISSVTPLINVDLLIKDDEGRTLLTWRNDEFYGSGWHIPGGIIRYKECARDRIQKVAEQELGCSVVPDTVPVLISESFAEQRERGHFISMLYPCRLVTDPDASLHAGETPRRGEWRWHDHLPDNLIPAQRLYSQFVTKKT
jgi:ADP-ribose pyrophosphatase YjhB (NUDIX family)